MYVRPVLLRLGPRALDVRTRALVTGVVVAAPDGLPARAGRLVADGADIVVVEGGEDEVVDAVKALVAALDVPVGVATPSAEAAAAAFEAGATLAEDRTGAAGAGWLAAAARAGATVTLAAAPAADLAAARSGATVTLAAPGLAVALRARAGAARAAGIDAERIALDPGRLVRPAPEVGYPLVLPLGPRPTLAAACAGVVLGYRVVRTTDVRTARRVADAVAAVLEAE